MAHLIDVHSFWNAFDIPVLHLFQSVQRGVLQHVDSIDLRARVLGDDVVEHKESGASAHHWVMFAPQTWSGKTEAGKFEEPVASQNIRPVPKCPTHLARNVRTVQNAAELSRYCFIVPFSVAAQSCRTLLRMC